MNCVLYSRVSTPEQADKDLSIPAQQQAMREHAARLGWTVVEEFQEPGVSAKTAQRPALQQLLAHIRNSSAKVDVVLVHKIDRLARNVYDHAMIKATLQSLGIRLASVSENVDETVTGELVENIMASIAQYYSANLSEEVKKGMRQKVLQGGWPHKPPRGYVVVRSGDTSTIETHPREAPLMCRAFELYATGWYSIKRLSERLFKDGLMSRSGGPIPQTHLRRLLEHSFYRGVVRWHEIERQGTHPALISNELFERVQQTLKDRYRNPGRKGSVAPGFPLRGLVMCSSCRGHMTSERHGKHRYYRCSRQTYRRELCPGRACNADRAHAGLKRICLRLRIDPTTAGEIRRAASRRITEQVADWQRQRSTRGEREAALLEHEIQLSKAFATGDVAPTQFNEETAALRQKRTEIEQSATAPPLNYDDLKEQVDRTIQLATSFWDLYEPLNEMRKAIMLKQLFDTVVLDQQGVAGFTLKSPFDKLFMTSPTPSIDELARTVTSAA